MELKHSLEADTNKLLDLLLIVPYGIETIFRSIRWRMHTELLIVPYGIETIVMITQGLTRIHF